MSSSFILEAVITSFPEIKSVSIIDSLYINSFFFVKAEVLYSFGKQEKTSPFSTIAMYTKSL